MKKMLQMLILLSALYTLSACTPATQPASTSPTTPTTLPQSTSAPVSDTPVAPSTATSSPAGTCASPAAKTLAMTEGPYFKANSPERSNLLTAGMPGTKLVLSGYVRGMDCKPVAGALLDFWQANADGQYDNSGYTLRGRQFSDATGHYQLTTVIPGLYPGRTEHIHVKVQAPNGSILTTQLFFPGVADNNSDGIFDPSLLMALQDAPDGKTASFTFVIDTP